MAYRLKYVLLLKVLLFTVNIYSISLNINSVEFDDDEIKLNVELTSEEEIYINECYITNTDSLVKDALGRYIRFYSFRIINHDKLIVWGGNMAPLSRLFGLNTPTLRFGEYVQFKGKKKFLLVLDKASDMTNFREIILEIEYFDSSYCDIGDLRNFNITYEKAFNNIKWIQTMHYVNLYNELIESEPAS